MPNTGNSVAIGKTTSYKGLNVHGSITADANINLGGNFYTNRIFPNSGETTNILANINVGTDTSKKNLVVSGNLGQPISQNDYLENLASNLSISEFECYKIGQYIKLHAKITLNSGNYTAGDKIADVKTAYKPKYTVVHNNAILYWQWGAITSIATSGNIDCKSTTSTTNANTTIDVFYQIA